MSISFYPLQSVLNFFLGFSDLSRSLCFNFSYQISAGNSLPAFPFRHLLFKALSRVKATFYLYTSETLGVVPSKKICLKASKDVRRNMDRNRVLLLTLIWIIQCVWGVRTQDNATDTTYYQDITTDVTDITELTSDVDVDSRNDSAENFQLDRICSWSISGTKKGLRIDWSGNATAESEVVVDAFSNDPNCRYASGETREKFSNKFADLTLCLNTRYVITVQFNCSTSETSREIWTPPEPPPDILIENVDNTSFAVSWSRPSGKGRIELYNVSVSDLKDFHLLQNNTAEKMLVSDLEPWTVYRVRVAAKNEDFWGEYSKETEVQTKVGTPGAPRNLRQTAIGNTSVTLNWDPPSANTGPISKYIVHWQNSSASSEEDTASNSTSYTVAHLAAFVHYTFKVSAVTEAGQGNWSEVLTIQTTVGIPYAPENLTNTSVSNTSVGLQWEEPKQSTGPISSYRVQWKNSIVEREEATLSNATFHTVKGLWPYVEYTFKVAAVTVVGRGTWSGECIVRTEVGEPYPPENLTIASFTNTSIGLTWDSPTLSTGPILNYHVHWRNSTHAFEADTLSNLTSYTVQKLRPYSVYTFKVLAVTEAGPGLWSDERHASTDIGIPYAPINLQETSVTNTSVSLKWNEPPEPMGPLLFYRIFWRNASAGGSEETPKNETFYTMKSLTPYVLYTFSVSAVTKAGAGKASEEIEVHTDVGVPHAPTNLKQTAFTNTSVSLKWEEPPVSTGAILRYRFHWKNSSRAGWEDTSTNDTFHTLERLTPFVKYTFTVSAITDAGTGESSEEVTVQTKVGVPHAPRDLTLTKTTNTSAELKWSEPPMSTGPIVGYRVHWKNSSSEGEEDTNSKTPFYTVQHLTPYVEYTFRVLALTVAGPGEWSKQVKDRTNIGVPHAPRDVTLTKVTNTSAALKWNEPSISTGPIVGYRIHWKNSSSDGEEDTNSTTLFYSVQHLTPYTDYTFRVLALTAAGPGEWSKQVKDRTKVGVPHAPRDVTLTTMTNTTAALKWNKPSISTGPIVGYRIHWKNSSSEGEENTKSTTPTYTVQHLTPYIDYTFRVLALTSAGPGEWSKQVTDRTKVGVPHAVEKFSATHVGNTSIDLAWNAPRVSTGPILKYRVRWKNSTTSGEEDTPSNSTRYKMQRLAPYVYYNLKSLAITEAGPGPWSKEVTVQTKIGVPHPPTQLTDSDVTNTSALLTWSEPMPSTGPIVSYTVHWNSTRGGGFNDTEERSFNVSNLFPYLNYTFTVSASTAAGRGEWSRSIVVETDIGVPSTPKKLRYKQVTNTTLSLKWNRPDYPNAPELEYRLTYRLMLRDDLHPVSLRIVVPASQESVSHVLPNLMPYTYYSIRVSAGSPAGESSDSDELIVRTEIGVPLPAKILDVKAMKRKTALLRWITEGPYPGPVDYTLETRKFPGLCSGSEKETVTKEMKGNQKADEWRREHVMEIGDLSPFGVYQFRILLKTSAKEKDVVSQMSFMIRIAPEAPSEPLDIRAECIGSPTELKISWKPPKEPNGLITSYRIQYGIERKNLTRLVHVNNMCQSQSYVLTGLRPERRYLIAISARVENVSEDGTSSQPSSVCTLPPGIPFLGDISSLQAEGSGSESIELVWTKEVFSDYMGAIVQYAVLVGRPNTLGNATSGTRTSMGPPWFNFSSGYSDFYQATPPGWNPSHHTLEPLGCWNHTEDNRTVLRCTLGLDKNCPRNETYCNGPLKPDTLYELKIRAFTRGGFTETDPIHARSGPIPKPSVGGKVAAVVVVLLLLAALAGGGYVMKKKGHLDKVIVRIQSHLNPKEEPPPKQEEPPMQMEECNTPKPIKTKYFAEHVRIMMSDSHLKFSLEFEKLKNESPRLPCTIAEMEENRAKNRWMNIFPFDHSRVKLLPLCDEPGSDFINANYIPGYSSRREYIATQGPLPHVLDDFWRMVWEQSVNVIVMLTQCVERGKKKCEKYWPDSGDTQYHGDLRITTVSVSMLSSYIIRIFHIQSGSYERLVKQMHFTHWPDFGCPECPEDLINFVSAVREHLPRVAPGPILVHCSAGVGRTGTFIAVDRLMLQLQHADASNHGEDTVDIYGTVLDLRQHRTNMVQTEDQYIYIHLCVRQLIEDRDRPRATGSQENIYSNLAIERDLPRSIKPTAPEFPR